MFLAAIGTVLRRLRVRAEHVRHADTGRCSGHQFVVILFLGDQSRRRVSRAAMRRGGGGRIGATALRRRRGREERRWFRIRRSISLLFTLGRCEWR